MTSRKDEDSERATWSSRMGQSTEFDPSIKARRSAYSSHNLLAQPAAVV